ncbi:MAG: AAA family ATPase, partial [Ilumatobacter sp.]|nr:AAA family ATPase [Ilumatobacter sp.]
MIPDGARFCPFCGAPQQDVGDLPTNGADVPADETRRVVTVLFADLVGFTSLSERLDPERVKRLVDDLFERLVADVEAFGGRVDKVLGDAIIALFGAPVAHEDDADRAVRAGLAMQRTVRHFRDEHPADAVRMRVGINTGEVLVGTLAGTDYTAMGDVVNTAARLQEVARPGSVLVGQATRDLCSSAIRFLRTEPVQLRGREQETCAFRAMAVEPVTMSRRWRSDVDLVGRVAEIGILEAALASVRSGRCVVAAVTVEAGIGKSRLVGEVVSDFLIANPETLLLEGACAPYGESNVWWPVAGGLMARLGLDRSAPADESRRRIVRRLGKLGDFEPGTPEFERTVELVMHLLGQPSALDALGPTGLRDAVVAGILSALRRRGERAPVIVWVDDLQWAAPVLLELLDALARQLANLPVLIVTTARSDDVDVAGWPPPVDPALAVHVALDALDRDAAVELVRRAADRELPDDVVDTITRRSGGNPLFLIELARLAASSSDDDVDAGRLPG